MRVFLMKQAKKANSHQQPPSVTVLQPLCGLYLQRQVIQGHYSFALCIAEITLASGLWLRG